MAINKIQENKLESAPSKTILIHYGLPSTNRTNPTLIEILGPKIFRRIPTIISKAFPGFPALLAHICLL